MCLERLARLVVPRALWTGVLFILVHDLLMLEEVESCRVAPIDALRSAFLACDALPVISFDVGSHLGLVHESPVATVLCAIDWPQSHMRFNMLSEFGPVHEEPVTAAVFAHEDPLGSMVLPCQMLLHDVIMKKGCRIPLQSCRKAAATPWALVQGVSSIITDARMLQVVTDTL